MAALVLFPPGSLDQFCSTVVDRLLAWEPVGYVASRRRLANSSQPSLYLTDQLSRPYLGWSEL